MSQPNSATIRYSNPTQQPPLKSSTGSLKNTQEKLTVDLNKFELKSLADSIGLFSEKSSARQQGQQYSAQTPQSQQIYSHQHYSPTSSSRKAPINPTTRPKNVHDKKNSLKLSLETLDFKDALTGSKKLYPATSKAVKSTYPSNPSEKIKTNLKKSSSISKEERVKSFLSTYEGIFDRKSPTNKDLNKIRSSMEQKDLRNNFMEAPPKKSSLPNNLTLTLNNIYGGAGSSSYRTPMSSGPVEFLTTEGNNKLPAYGPTLKYKARKSEEGEEEHMAPIVTNSSGVMPQAQLQAQQGPSKYSFNNLLIDLAKISSDPTKNISKISINNINNINTINNSHVIPEERITTAKDSADYATILREKNEEIQKLSRDKIEMRATLEILVHEINELKKGRSGGHGERDDLTPSAVEHVSSTNESKEITHKESQSARQIQHQLQNARKVPGNMVSKDMESVKMIVDQLKTMTDNSEKAINKALEQKNSLIETLTKESLRKTKKSSYTLLETQGKDVKKQNQPSNFNLYQRSASTTIGEDIIGKKTRESPYYEPPKGNKKTKDNGALPNSKKPISAGLSASSYPIFKTRELKKGMHEDSGRGELYIDTPGLETLSSLVRTQPNTATNAELDLLRRKFSHDPKLVSEVISETLEKKSVGDGMEEFYSYESMRDKEGERVDIGSALGELKGRIAKVLDRYRDSKTGKKIKSK